MAAAFVRSDDPTLFPPAAFPPPEDTTSGAGAPDIELIATPMAYTGHGLGPKPHGAGDAFGLHAVVLRYVPLTTHRSRIC